MNTKARYELVHACLSFLQQWISLKVLVILFYAMVVYKYYHYGINSFGMEWRTGFHPNLWNHLTTLLTLGIKKHLWMVPVSFLIDHFFWPYVFKDELK